MKSVTMLATFTSNHESTRRTDQSTKLISHADGSMEGA